MPSITSKYDSKIGPLVEVLIGIDEPLRKYYQRNGRAAPSDIPVVLLIDTGADTTTLSEMHMRSLGIEAINITPVHTITTGATGESCPVYSGSLRLQTRSPHDRVHVLPTMELLAREFNHGFDGLLGRDVLSTLRFTVDGPNKSFRLEWPG